MKNVDDQTQLRVAFYIRVSTEEQVEKYGPDLQKSALEGLLHSKGKLDDGRDKLVFAGERYIYKDEGISGTIPLDERPAFAQLKEDLLYAPEEQKPFDLIAVYKIDRFARRLKILLEVIDYLEEKKIQFISANESIDTSTPFGRAMLGIIGVIAELEIETTRERTQAGRLEAIKKGVVMGGSAIYGYKKDTEKRLMIFEEEAKIVRLIFDKFVNEKNFVQQIANYLTDHDYPSPGAAEVVHGKRKGEVKKKNDLNFWRGEKIRKILSDEVYIGNYYYEKTVKGKRLPPDQWKLSPYHHPNIIDNYLFKQTEVLLKQSKQLSNAKYKTADNHVYLLSGLLRCDGCRRPEQKDNELMTWVGDRKRLEKKDQEPTYTYAYKCGRKNQSKNPLVCKVIPIPAVPIEDYIVNLTKELLKDPKAVYDYQLNLKSSQLEVKKLRNKREETKKLLNAIPNRKKSIKEQHELGFLSTPTLTTKYKELNESEKRLKSELLKIEHKLAENSFSEGYEKTLKLFSNKYAQTLNDTYKNRQEVFDIFHMLISSITVYSRPVTKKDKIAGRKKADQLIPYKLEMELKLPQDILNDFASRFGVKSADL